MKSLIKFLKGIFCLFIFIIVCAYISNLLEDDQFVLNTYANTFKEEKSYASTLFNNLLDQSIFKKVIDSDGYKVGKLVNSSSKPVIYIHNTHQTEGYVKDSNMKTDFTVFNAAYLLKNKLDSYGLKTIVEDRSVKKVLNERNWDYSYSYRITKEYTNEILKNNPSIRLVIDLHRDSANKSVVTTSIKDKSYAKIMFLLGKNHDNYSKNEDNINKLKAILEKNYPGITRNTFVKNQYTYNQEVMPLFFTIELGANTNTTYEVYNSINALADAISIFMRDSI